MGVEKNEVENTIYELLLGESKLEDCIIPLNFDNLSLIPSNVNLAGAGDRADRGGRQRIHSEKRN